MNILQRGLLVVLGIEGEFDGDRVAIALPASDSCRYGQQRAASLAIAPDARIPRHAVNDGSDGGPTPRVTGGASFLGMGAKVHPPFVGISKESADERIQSRE
jgi:hypothetical protein